MVRDEIFVCYKHYCLPFTSVLTLYLGCIWLMVSINRLCVSSCFTSCTDWKILRQRLGWTSVMELELVVLSLHVISCQPTFMSCSTVTIGIGWRFWSTASVHCFSSSGHETRWILGCFGRLVVGTEVTQQGLRSFGIAGTTTTECSC